MAYDTLEYTLTLTRIECGVCHIPFAIPSNLYKARLQDGKDFWCPNGHAVHYFDNDNRKLRAQVAQLTDDRQWYSDQMKAARKDAELQRRRAAAAKGQLTKIRNRVANGMCPVPGCKRSFTNVLDHLRNEHPDYHRHEES